MSPFVLYLIGIGAGMLLGVVCIELSDARERARRWREFDELRQLDAARDITGRAS